MISTQRIGILQITYKSILEMLKEESMPYDQDFYLAYEKYLQEDAVRQAHDWIFSIVRQYPAFQKVLDLGCGYSHEYERYFRPEFYIGLDLHGQDCQRGDYRSIDFAVEIRADVTAFVSLFSSEITGTPQENYQLYDKIFDKLPVQSGLVSGFFYSSKRWQEVVDESGGIKSHQTIENIADFSSTRFGERRIVLPVPSKLFGDDVYEVWKIFHRREPNPSITIFDV